ncbi:MAG: hypothetical protein KC503_20170 [Myxococcales bacterium]|nr:hypothetical protein [Myxococcales bacterium]
MTTLDPSALGLFDDEETQAQGQPRMADDGFGEEMVTMRTPGAPRELPVPPPGSPRVASHTLQGVGLAEIEAAAAAATLSGSNTATEMPLYLSDLRLETVRTSPSRAHGLPTLPTGMSPVDTPPDGGLDDRKLGTTLPPQPLTELQNAALQRSAKGTDPMGLSGTAEVATRRAASAESTDEVTRTVERAVRMR